MTGLWLLQLHIMLSQRGRGRKRGRGGREGEGCCSRRQLPHINLMHPRRPRVSPTAIRSLVRTVSRFAAKRQPSFFSSFLVLSVVCRFLRWRKRERRRINCAPCSCFGTHPSGDLSHRGKEHRVPKPPYMHHKGKWENGGKREREGDQRGRWDQVSKNEMQFFSSSALLYVQLLSCARLWLCGLYEDLRLGWYAMHI